ncbi:hypothetical protein CS0771_45460 [Catellatospora sp. IY07-71]|uniref:hypothetical protein n=1 Tax=Catellatospora sp. IY07-71 TaxID=2728827 RepID=UPI001BB37CB8|nr:hypothetical protein [Catellatospora sp. IY07-71]BCJ75002.1 hypothetical protein CS0771_45460 [Catellatospora sp. IY07-71]
MSQNPPQLPNLWRLTWLDVDPSRREFDPAAVASIVRALPPADRVPAPGTDWRLVDFWYDEMTAALVDSYGPWVVGWPYRVEMEDTAEYGRIPAWRQENPPITAPGEVLAGIADAVVAWQGLLTELSTDPRSRFVPSSARAIEDDDGVPRAWRVVMGPVKRLVFPQHPRLPHPAGLSWAEVDPARRRFDPETVPAVLAGVPAAASVPAPHADWRLIDLWLETVTSALVEQYGTWVVGWRWSIGEGDLDGGVVGAWCCASHSITTPEATRAAVAASVVEWHDWLVDLAERFARFLPLPGDLPADDALDGWERAVAHLVTAVGDRTQYESGWYGCCRTVLGWFLTAAGMEDRERRDELIAHATDGRFASWVEPSRADVHSVAERLAEQVVRAGT